MPPGETPPAEGSTSGVSHREPTPPTKAGGITIFLIALVTLLVLGMIAAQIIGLIDVL